MRSSLSFSHRLERETGMTIAHQRDFRKTLASAYAVRFLELKRPIFHVFGKAQAATAPAAVGAYEAGLSYLFERVDEPNKNYGYHQKIEGDYEYGELVGLGDDVVTNGASKVEGAKVLYAVGLQPSTITIQFDREEGGVQTLEEDYGFEVNAITSMSRAAPILLANRRITSREIDSLQTYYEGLRQDGVTTTFDLAA